MVDGGWGLRVDGRRMGGSWMVLEVGCRVEIGWRAGEDDLVLSGNWGQLEVRLGESCT